MRTRKWIAIAVIAFGLLAYGMALQMWSRRSQHLPPEHLLQQAQRQHLQCTKEAAQAPTERGVTIAVSACNGELQLATEAAEQRRRAMHEEAMSEQERLLNEKEPQWREIVTSRGFTAWLEDQPATRRAECQKTADAQVMLDCIRDYDRSLKRTK